MAVQRNAALLGASGLVGGFCLEALVADSWFSQITLLNRRELPIASNARLIQKAVNFETIAAADFAEVEFVFCALGTTMSKAGSKEAFRRVDLDYPLAAARAARQAGARTFVLVSSVGANATTGNFYLRTKGELEEQLKPLGFEAVHIFRPSLLLGKRKEFRLGERIMIPMAPLLNLPLMGGLKRYRAISAETVGRAMLSAAKREERGLFFYHYDEIQKLASMPR